MLSKTRTQLRVISAQSLPPPSEGPLNAERREAETESCATVRAGARGGGRQEGAGGMRVGGRASEAETPERAMLIGRAYDHTSLSLGGRQEGAGGKREGGVLVPVSSSETEQQQQRRRVSSYPSLPAASDTYAQQSKKRTQQISLRHLNDEASH
jgi:hypothetical protein